MIHRYREQARSYRGFLLLRNIHQTQKSPRYLNGSGGF